MRITTVFSRLVHRFTRRRPGRLTAVWMMGALVLVPLVLAACNDTPPTDAALSDLHWCDKQTLLFQDASQTPPATLTDWKKVTKALDFTVYLPPRLPVGSCLVSGEALIHDKVLGSSFGVSYLLPGGVSLAFSETAVSSGETASFQCSQSNAPAPTATPNGTPTDTPTATPTSEATGTPTDTPIPEPTVTPTITLLCLGGKGNTNIVIDSSEAEKDIKTLFSGMQSGVDWIPQK